MTHLLDKVADDLTLLVARIDVLYSVHCALDGQSRGLLLHVENAAELSPTDPNEVSLGSPSRNSLDNFTNFHHSLPLKNYFETRCLKPTT